MDEAARERARQLDPSAAVAPDTIPKCRCRPGIDSRGGSGGYLTTASRVLLYLYLCLYLWPD